MLGCVYLVGIRFVIIWRSCPGWISFVTDESSFCSHVLSWCLHENDRRQLQNKYAVDRW